MVLLFFFFLFNNKLRMSETYRSAELRVAFLNDKKGKLIKTDTFFANLYDFWTCYHASYKILFIWYLQKCTYWKW